MMALLHMHRASRVTMPVGKAVRRRDRTADGAFFCSVQTAPSHGHGDALSEPARGIPGAMPRRRSGQADAAAPTLRRRRLQLPASGRYGEHVFPLQVVFLPSRPGADFDGGEPVLTE